jgi:hypothetical protein
VPRHQRWARCHSSRARSSVRLFPVVRQRLGYDAGARRLAGSRSLRSGHTYIDASRAVRAIGPATEPKRDRSLIQGGACAPLMPLRMGRRRQPSAVPRQGWMGFGRARRDRAAPVLEGSWGDSTPSGSVAPGPRFGAMPRSAEACRGAGCSSSDARLQIGSARVRSHVEQILGPDRQPADAFAGRVIDRLATAAATPVAPSSPMPLTPNRARRPVCRTGDGQVGIAQHHRDGCRIDA